MAKRISNSDEVIDSRDVIKRIEELASEHETLTDAVTEAREDLEIYNAGRNGAPMGVEGAGLVENLERAQAALAVWASGDKQTELSQLRALADQGEKHGDWHYGETLFRESYFASIDFGGVTYYMRS